MVEASNEIDGVKINRFVAELEKIDEELLSEKMSYASRCRPLQDRKKDWKQRAADDGIPKDRLNDILAERRHLRAIAKINSALESEDDRELLAQMRTKLKPVADLPLFSAAIAAQERKAAPDEDRDLRPPALQKREADRGVVHLADIKKPKARGGKKSADLAPEAVIPDKLDDSIPPDAPGDDAPTAH